MSENQIERNGNSRKFLLGIIAVQALGITALGFQLQGVRQDVQATQEIIANKTLHSASNDDSIVQTSGLSAEEIRAIIRSENTTLVRATLVAERVNEQGHRASRPDIMPPSPVVDRQKVEDLNTDIDRLLSRMSAADVAAPRDVNALLGNIAKLPPEERARALGKFNRALNSGTVAAAL